MIWHNCNRIIEFGYGNFVHCHGYTILNLFLVQSFQSSFINIGYWGDKEQRTNQLKSVMNRATQLHELLIYWVEYLSRHHELHEHIDSRSQTISSALILFSVSLACIHPQVACIFLVRYAFRQYAFLINPPNFFFLFALPASESRYSLCGKEAFCGFHRTYAAWECK